MELEKIVNKFKEELERLFDVQNIEVKVFPSEPKKRKMVPPTSLSWMLTCKGINHFDLMCNFYNSHIKLQWFYNKKTFKEYLFYPQNKKQPSFSPEDVSAFILQLQCDLQEKNIPIFLTPK